MEITTGKRRSQRLFLQVRVVVEGNLANKSPFSEETHTIVVNAHGALVEMGIVAGSRPGRHPAKRADEREN